METIMQVVKSYSENVNNASEAMVNTNTNGTRLALRTTANDVVWRNIQGCKNFTTPVTINEAMEAINANYEVQKESLIRVPQHVINAILNGDPNVGLSLTKDMIIQSHMATVRKDIDHTLGVVGSKYGVVQNEKAFEFMNLLTSGFEGHEKAIVETAGILDEGARIYVTAKMPSDIFLDGNNGDPINDYILFTNTHDGSGAVMAFFTPVRVVCQNTLNMAIKQAQNKVVYKHTTHVNARMDFSNRENVAFVTEVLNRHRTFTEAFKNSLLSLRSEQITDKDTMRFIAQVVLGEKRSKEVDELEKANFNLDAVDTIKTRTRNIITDMRNTIESGVGQDKYRGTKLWLLNGLTTYFSNEKKYSTNEDKFNSIMGGTDTNKLNEAFKLLSA